MDDFGIGSITYGLVEFPDGTYGVGMELTMGELEAFMPLSIEEAVDVAASLVAAARLAKLRNIAGQN